jgi:hypothetical protein
MSGFRRAVPFLIAAGTGIISGIYIFKPLVVEEANELSNPPSQSKVATDGHKESQDISNKENV